MESCRGPGMYQGIFLAAIMPSFGGQILCQGVQIAPKLAVKLTGFASLAIDIDKFAHRPHRRRLYRPF